MSEDKRPLGGHARWQSLGLYETFEHAVILVLTAPIAVIVVVRKVIILDLNETEPAKVFALAAAILALGIVCWLVRDQDQRERFGREDGG
jgi:uncharacterized membrane protein (DUF373 family)